MPKHYLAPTLAALLCLVAIHPAQAQQIYRHVGADGKVTFSDRPPADGGNQPNANARSVARGTGASQGNPALPLALRQVVERFPVTLYSGADCTPCVGARNLLTLRGVPFTERTVATNEDIAALQRLSGNTSLPFGTIGSQQLVGFSEADWAQYLDAAGYPKQSQLPPGYRTAAARPLTEPKPVAEPNAAPAAPSVANPAPQLPSPAPAPAPAPAANPAGIRF